MFGNHGLCGLLEEGAHEKSPKCLGGNLGDFGGILQRSHIVKLSEQEVNLLFEKNFFNRINEIIDT